MSAALDDHDTPALAASHIAAMHGPHRLPTQLKAADRPARGFAPPRSTK